VWDLSRRVRGLLSGAQKPWGRLPDPVFLFHSNLHLILICVCIVVYHVLLHLHKRLPLGSFFRLLEDGGKLLTPAGKLLEVYAREQNRELLRDFCYSDDRRVESAVLSLDEATRASVCILLSDMDKSHIFHFLRTSNRRKLL